MIATVKDILVSNAVVQPLTYSVFEAADVEVFIKRDDLIHPIISGNKWRKLNLQIADAKAKGKTTLVTFGGAYSNHLVATACAGKLAGMNTVAFLRGEEARKPNHYDLLCRLYGMTQIPVSRDAYRNKPSLFHTHFGLDHDAYFIDEGGAGPLGAKGCEVIADELQEHYDYICLPVGTATTMRGITDAIVRKQWHTKVIGFSTMKQNHDLDAVLSDIDPSYWQIYHDYHRGGYGKTDRELMAFIQQFTSETGILADPVYVGKMLMGLQDLVQQNIFPKQSKILCIHTGGNLGLFSEQVLSLL